MSEAGDATGAGSDFLRGARWDVWADFACAFATCEALSEEICGGAFRAMTASSTKNKGCGFDLIRSYRISFGQGKGSSFSFASGISSESHYRNPVLS